MQTNLYVSIQFCPDKQHFVLVQKIRSLKQYNLLTEYEVANSNITL